MRKINIGKREEYTVRKAGNIIQEKLETNQETRKVEVFYIKKKKEINFRKRGKQTSQKLLNKLKKKKKNILQEYTERKAANIIQEKIETNQETRKVEVFYLKKKKEINFRNEGNKLHRKS